MRRWKAAAVRLLFPPDWIVAAVSLAGYGGVIWVLVHRCTGPLAYFIYLISAYALAVDIAALPGLRRSLKKRATHFKRHSCMLMVLRKTSLGRRYLDSPLFRARISLYQGMAINFLYTVFRAVTGVWYGSAWFLSIAAYHFLLGTFRAYLVFRYRRAPSGRDAFSYQVRSYKTTGWLLLLLNIPMSGMVVMMVRENSGFVYPGVVIYLSALYTFYMAAVSVVNLIKSRRLNSPIFLAARILHFVSAAMSVLGLQTAMISRFGAGDSGFRQLMNTITGAGVCALAIGAGVFMIVKSKIVYFLRDSVRSRCFSESMGKGGAPLNRSESKYFNTAAKMDEAFISLLAEKEFQYITVKEICQRAGVHRSTFYLHYETMADLLDESLRYVNETFLDQFKGGPADIGSRIRKGEPEELYLVTPEYLKPYLQFIKENKILFRTVVNQPGVFSLDEIYASMFRHVFDPILERFHVPEEQRRYMMVFYIHGLIAVVSQWLKNGCKEPVEQMIQIIERCVMDGRKERSSL